MPGDPAETRSLSFIASSERTIASVATASQIGRHDFTSTDRCGNGVKGYNCIELQWIYDGMPRTSCLIEPAKSYFLGRTLTCICTTTTTMIARLPTGICRGCRRGFSSTVRRREILDVESLPDRIIPRYLGMLLLVDQDTDLSDTEQKPRPAISSPYNGPR